MSKMKRRREVYTNIMDLFKEHLSKEEILEFFDIYDADSQDLFFDQVGDLVDELKDPQYKSQNKDLLNECK